MKTKADQFLAKWRRLSVLSNFARTQFMVDYINGLRLRLSMEDMTLAFRMGKGIIFYDDGSIAVLENGRWNSYVAREGHVRPLNASRSMLWDGTKWIVQVDLAIEKPNPKEKWDADAYGELLRQVEDPLSKDRPASWVATVAVQKLLHGEDPDKARPTPTGDEEKDSKISSLLKELGFGDLGTRQEQ